MGEDRIKLAKAAVYSYSDEQGVWSQSAGLSGEKDVAKMKLPKVFSEIVEMCRFFYKRDPLGATVINKMVEIGITSLHNKKGDCSDQEYAVFDSLKEGLLDFLRDCCLEYLLSGLIIVEKDWQPVKASDMDIEGNGTFSLPTNFWFRNPESIEIRETPIPNRYIYLVKISEEQRKFIQSKGTFDDGVKDEQTWEILKSQYKKFVDAVNEGKKVFVLEDPMVVRRKPISGSPYPTPFLYPALETMILKRNLKKMDFSIASRVISAIQLISVGSDQFPVTADDQDVIDDLKKAMNWREQPGFVDRVFQLFVNHTVKIGWVYPDTAALLSESKYINVNQDILFALGFPRVLIVGETARSGTSTTEFALLGPTETLNDVRSQLLIVVKEIYKQILERNPTLKSAPEPAFTPVRLSDIIKLATIAKDAYEHGIISKTTYGMLIGEDYQKEVEYMADEKQTEEELGLTTYPEVPYSPKPSGKQQQQQQPTDGTPQQDGENA
jgi:hypothetical protein